MNQLFMENYTDDVTELGTAMQIGTGMLGIDVVADLRDISADIFNWEWSLGHSGQTAADIVGLVPVIGALKYGDEVGILLKPAIKNGDKLAIAGGGAIKHTDEVTDHIKSVTKGNSKNVNNVSGSGKATIDKADDLAQGAGKSSVVKYGDQYDKIGNKKVLKSNVEYTDSNGYKYLTDNNGRISNVQGNLQLGEGTRNEYAQRTVGGVDRLTADDGGHLIGSQFNGSGQIDNLVPQNSSINRVGGEWYKMEQRWADALKEESSVKVDITPIYESNTVRPSTFKVDYWIDGEKISKEVMNP